MGVRNLDRRCGIERGNDESATEIVYSMEYEELLQNHIIRLVFQVCFEYGDECMSQDP